MPAPTITTTTSTQGTAGDDSSATIPAFAGTAGKDLIQGLAGDDTISGAADDDQLEGGDGNDTLNGEAGNDNLAGGAGTNLLTGGAGNDSYTIISASDTISELVGEGTDTIYADVSYNLAANVENITLEAATALNSTGNALANIMIGNAEANTLRGGAGNDTLSGMAGVDLLVGEAGSDALDGGLGADTMTGGDSNDTYTVDNVGDVIVEVDGEGAADAVSTSVTYTLSANVEDLTLTGAAAINGTGNAGINTITGNTANNVLDGGAGVDAMIGGTGDDNYVVDNAGDVVTEAALGGTDTVTSSVSYTIGVEIENLTLAGGAREGIGNAGANIINGTANGGNTANRLIGMGGVDTLNGRDGNDYLRGGAGDIDSMVGGIGNDTYIVEDAGDIVTEAAAEGTDRIISTVNVTALAANVENVILSGIATDATGNALDNLIYGTADGLQTVNILDGGDGNDELFGRDGDDTLTGGAGNDTLRGGTGVDAMTGGAGSDTYFVDDEGDTVTEALGEGRDQVFTTANIGRLAGNVENVRMLGAADLRVDANGQTNELKGNDGDNVMHGRGGRDFILGFEGEDIIIGGRGRDNLWGGEGDDDFIYTDFRDSVAGRNRDVIRDFDTGNDQIDLSRIESGVVGGDFTFIGDDAFSGRGQVRYENSVIEGDINGDGVAEFHIVIASGGALTADDFIL